MFRYQLFYPIYLPKYACAYLENLIFVTRRTGGSADHLMEYLFEPPVGVAFE